MKKSVITLFLAVVSGDPPMSPCAKVSTQNSENPFTHVRDCRGKPDPKGNAPTIIRKHELTVITYFLKVIRIMTLFRNFETSNEHGYE